ncbi:MAG: hypothetical protein LBF37_03365 [Rickettsiales bacterium]|jgi:hypothetical protein|nr:hypothetical protein [Rickettsiales bacterium]
MKIIGFALFAMSLSVSTVFAETSENSAQLLDVVIGESVTDDQIKCIQEKMVECEIVGLPVETPVQPDVIQSETEKVPGVARRRVNRAGLKSTGKNQIVKLAVPGVPLSEVEQLSACVTAVMVKCNVTDYQINRMEQTAVVSTEDNATETKAVVSETVETPETVTETITVEEIILQELEETTEPVPDTGVPVVEEK